MSDVPPAGTPASRRFPAVRRTVAVAATLAALIGVGGAAIVADDEVKSEPTVVRLVKDAGALAVAVHDPGVTLAVDGHDLRISGDGLADLRLNTDAWSTDAPPGDGAGDGSGTGDAAARPLLSVERDGRTLIDVRWEPRRASGAGEPVAAPADGGPGFTPPESGPNGEPGGGPNGLALVRRYEGHTAAVKDVAISPDGTLFAGGSGWPFGDETARVWDAESGALLHTFPHPGLVQCVAFSPDGAQLLTGTADAVVRIWDCSEPAAADADAPAADNDGNAASAADRLIREYRGARGIVLDANLSPDGKWVIATGYNERGVHLWECDGGRSRFLRSPDAAPMRRATFSPDGRRALGQNGNGQVFVWDLDSGEFESALPPAASPTNGAGAGLALLGDDRLLAGAGDGVVRLWNFRTGALLREIQTPVAVQALALLPDPSPDRWRVVAVGGAGRPDAPELAVLDLAAGTVDFALNYGGGILWAAAATPNRRRLLTASGSRRPVGQQRGQRPTGDNALSLWSLPTTATRP